MEDDRFLFRFTFIDTGHEKAFVTHYRPKHLPLSSELTGVFKYLGLHDLKSCPEFDFEPCFYRSLQFQQRDQPTFGFKGGLERSARTRFPGCRFGSLSQSLVSQLPVRLVTINCGQGEHKGRRRISIGNTLTAEVSLDFIVPKGHSAKVARLPSFVERRSGELVLRQNINFSKLLLNSLNAPRAIRVLGSAFRAMFAAYVSGSGRWKDAQIDGRLFAVQFDKIDQHQLCPGKNGALVGQRHPRAIYCSWPAIPPAFAQPRNATRIRYLERPRGPPEVRSMCNHY
jgi:hypothetical protein